VIWLIDDSHDLVRRARVCLERRCQNPFSDVLRRVSWV
jgi:hypothetical protein